MELQHSQELDKIAPALSALQGELPHVGKDSKGYGYNYADLASTLDVLKPLLVKHGFSITQFGSGNSLVTMLIHNSGQFIKGVMELIDFEMKGTNAAQNRGAVISYFRRYAVQAIVGMASEDSDATTKTAANTKAQANLDKADHSVKAQQQQAVFAQASLTSLQAKQPASEKAQATSAVASRGSFRKNPAAAANEEL
jgi:hypothetical protein